MPYWIFICYSAPVKGKDKKAIQNVAKYSDYDDDDIDDNDELEQNGYELEESDTENCQEELSEYEKERAEKNARNKRKFEEYYANCKTLKANSKKRKTSTKKVILMCDNHACYITHVINILDICVRMYKIPITVYIYIYSWMKVNMELLQLHSCQK